MVSSLCSISILTHATALPFLGKLYLMKVHSKHINFQNPLNVFHQNIVGVRKKSDELNSFQIDGTNLHLLCINEYHVLQQDLLHHTLNSYLLGSSFCRQNLQEGRCVHFFFKKRKISVSTKLMFHITVKDRIWKLCNSTRNKRLPTLNFSDFTSMFSTILRTISAFLTLVWNL